MNNLTTYLVEKLKIDKDCNNINEHIQKAYDLLVDIFDEMNLDYTIEFREYKYSTPDQKTYIYIELKNFLWKTETRKIVGEINKEFRYKKIDCICYYGENLNDEGNRVRHFSINKK